jgi:acetylornithine deacetylase
MRALDPVDALATLVAFPTVSDRPVTELAAWMAQRAEDAGLRVERFETSPGKCNVLATAGPEEEDGLLLSGHMDVVPVEGQPWSRDPFRRAAVGDRLYGRGACDMKAFLAAVSSALPDLPLDNLRRRLVLAWTHDEEVGCHGSRALVDRLAAEGRALPSLALIGEPTDLRILRAHAGHTTMRVHCHGVAAHSSRPSLGASAITMAGQVLAGLERLQATLAATRPDGLDPLILDALENPYPVLNCGQVHGGTAVNVIADHCDLWIGARQLPGQPGEELVARVAQVCAEVQAAWADRGGRITVHPLHEAPALLTPAGTPLEALLRPHARDPRPGAAPFATDGGNLARAGVQSLVFGPGSIDVAHKPDEYVPVDQLLATREVVSDVVRRRCLRA